MVLMQPIAGSAENSQAFPFNSPNAPRIENPTAHEQACLDGYWKAVMKHGDFVAEMQKEQPGWLPKFEMVGV
jgi:hypothetical protein